MYFISYASKDSEVVKKYVELLKSRVGSKNVWFAPERIKESKHYVKEIVNAINNSKAMILFLSKNSLNSPHVIRELDQAVSKGKKIYPLRIEDVYPNEVFEYFLSTYQWIDIFSEKDFKKFLERLFSLNIKLEEDELEEFVKLHFKNMGYKVKKENEFLKVTKDQFFFYVLPIYKENIHVGQLNYIEAHMLWEYRDLIFDKKDLEKFYEKYNFRNDPTHKQIMLFSRIMKQDKEIKKKRNIVFYLYIKNPPTFQKKEFQIGLINEYKYYENEKMSQIYINSVFSPGWWGVGRDNLETIKEGKYYKDITIEALNAYKKLKSKSNKQKESYNGRLAESLCEVFFRNNGYLVQKFGIENVLGNTLKLINTFNKDLENKEDLYKYMTLPDFLVMKVDSTNKLQDNFLLDVKFRQYYCKEDFKKDLKNGEIKKQAQKYKNFWGNIYLFIIADFGDEVEIYFDKVDNILEGKIKPLDKHDFKKDEINKLKKYAQTIWGVI